MSKLLFSHNQKVASSVFKRYRNDITIFTEDKESNEKKFYICFFTKLMEGSGIKIHDIFPIGDCDEVNEQELNDKDFSFPKIYVTDGDIYLMYSPKQERKRYYPLNRYCIENYLIEEKQICKAGAYLSRNLEEADVKRLLNYHEIMLDFANHIIPIFYYYCLLAKSGGFEIESYGRFYDNKKRIFKDDEIQKALTNMKQILINERKVKAKTINTELKQLEQKYPINIDTLIKYVSAKNFTFSYLREKLLTECGIKIGVEHEVWKKICAENLDYKSLSGLRKKIIDLCEGN